MKKACVFLLLLCLAAPAWADRLFYDEMTITAAYRPQDTDDLGADVIIITKEDIAKAKPRDLAGLLNLFAGIDISRNGQNGQLVSLYIRGANPNHCLVLVNGFRVNDPSSIGNSCQLNDINMAEIEKIEIIKSAQGSVYGSDALGGVINIITKPKLSDGFSLDADLSLSSADGHAESLLLGYAKNGFTASLSVDNEDYQDFYATDPDLAGNDDEDPFQKTTVAGRFGYEGENSRHDLNVRFFDSNTHIDMFGGAYGDDPNYAAEIEDRLYVYSGLLRFAGLEWRLRAGRHDIRREYINNIDDISTSIEDSYYDGTVDSFDFSAAYKGFLLGLSFVQDSMRYRYFSDTGYGPYIDELDEQKQERFAAYGEYGLHGDSAGVLVNLRYDDVKDIGSEMTFRLSPYLCIGETTTFYGNISSAYKAPSLYQLYSPYGNQDLAPETSLSWEVGVKQQLADGKYELQLTYFFNRFEDLIDFDSATYLYFNIGEARTSGLEFSAQAAISETTQLRLMAQYLDAENTDTGERLLRRPEYTYSLVLDTMLPFEIGLWLEAMYAGDRDDTSFDENYNTVRVSLDSYFLCNINIYREIAKGLTINVRVDNLFDENYQTIAGYARGKRVFYAGLSYQL